MTYSVVLTEAAEQDLESLNDYIAAHDSPAQADRFLAQVMEVIDHLAEMPERGAYPKELEVLGRKEFRQVLFWAYRIIYRIDGRRVLIEVVADGRRDMRALLERRLLGR